MTNEEFAFNYADKEFMHYGDRVALEPPVEIRTLVDPRPKTLGELIRRHEGVRGIQFSTDEPVMYRPPIAEVGMGENLENVSSKI